MNIQTKFSKVVRYLTDTDYRFAVNRAHFGLYQDMPDEEYLKKVYRYKMGYELNLEHPQTFSEKLQWLKLHDRKPEYTRMVDKYEMKQYIADTVGEDYVIPTLGIYDRAEEIDFSSLPDQFVLKCTHNSHSIVICKDKSKLNQNEARKKMQEGLQKNYYYRLREWCYKDVKPRIIAEKFMSNQGEDLIDFKVHAFNGTPRVILVCKDRFSKGNYTQDFFDCDWNHLPVKRPKSKNATVVMKQPKCLGKMLEISQRLSEGIPFLRTDFYIIEKKLYIGELTFFPASGLVPFQPESFDREMGSWLRLPKNY